MGTLAPILEMRKLRLRDAKKLIQVSEQDPQPRPFLLQSCYSLHSSAGSLLKGWGGGALGMNTKPPPWASESEMGSASPISGGRDKPSVDTALSGFHPRQSGASGGAHRG